MKLYLKANLHSYLRMEDLVFPSGLKCKAYINRNILGLVKNGPCLADKCSHHTFKKY